MHISNEFLKLIGAISVVKTKDSIGKKIARKRALLSLGTIVVNGMDNKLVPAYGRIFSGFIDTNRGGGLVNALITTYCLILQDKKYSRICNQSPAYMLVMGDDNLNTYDPNYFKQEQFKSDMASLGFDINPDKGEYGTFFLQYRLIKTGEGSYEMKYP